jgi:predicted phage terminase large subunit-like protein
VLLYDAWDDYLGFPQLKEKMKKDHETRWGDKRRQTDLLLIEDKGSGKSVKQVLGMEDLPVYGYSPGADDKVARLHAVTPLFAMGRVWVPESNRRSGEPMAWAEPLIEQLTTFPFAEHDDYVDTVSQALSWLRDAGALQGREAAPKTKKEKDSVVVQDRDVYEPDPEAEPVTRSYSMREKTPVEEDREMDEEVQKYHGQVIKIRYRNGRNPYIR